MNLAQLIDPERAREGFGEQSRDKPSPRPARGVVMHTQAGDVVVGDLPRMEVAPRPEPDIAAAPPSAPKGLSLAARIRAALKEFEARAGTAELHPGDTFDRLVGAVGCDPDRLQVALSQMVIQKDAVRVGERGRSRWRLTAKGRAKL